MTIQIEAAAAGVIITACVSLCWLIMRLCLKPVLDNQKAQGEILRMVKGPDDLANLIDKRASLLIHQHRQECEGRDRHLSETKTMTIPRLVGVIIIALLLAWMSVGCAHYEVDPATGQGTSYGFLRNLTVSEETVIEARPDGSTLTSTRRTVTTTSTTGDVLLGANELIGTMVDAAEKVKP